MQTRARSGRSVEDRSRSGEATHSSAGPGDRRKSRSASDNLTKVLDTLNSEHRYIESLLNTLEEQGEKLHPGKIPDYQLLFDILDYLTRYPDQYHHPREDLLFAKMLKREPVVAPKISRLQREHEALGRYNQQILSELQPALKGAPVDRARLLDQLSRYISGYRQHMEFESSQVFPRARGSLSKADMQALLKHTLYLDDPVFGHSVQQQYRRLRHKLRNQLGIVQDTLVNRELTFLETSIARVSSLVEILDYWRPAIETAKPGILIRRIGSLSRRLLPYTTPSWQARVLNTCTKTLVKPMMKFGTVDSMRSVTGTMDNYRGGNLPKDVVINPVLAASFKGDWIAIAGKRSRKIILYFPGGGFVMRTRHQHGMMASRICRAANVKALLVHYRLAPECPFPSGLEDCIAAYHFLLDEGWDSKDVILAGDSAGGGLVLSALLALRDEGAPMPSGAVVLSPLADLTYSGHSRKFNAHRDPMIPNHRASQMHALYIGEALASDRYISPILADFEGLPPIMGVVGSTEVLLDDTIRAAIRAEAAAIPFYLDVWKELPHVFPMFSVLPESKIAIERIAKFIRDGRIAPLPGRYGHSRISHRARKAYAD